MKLFERKISKPSIEMCTQLVLTGKNSLAAHSKLTNVAHMLAEHNYTDEQQTAAINEADKIASDLKETIEGIYHRGGCHVEFEVGQEAVKASCVAEECPFYPNGPDRVH